MSRRLAGAAMAVFVLSFPTLAAYGQDAPGANLGGYDSLAEALVFSFQPVLPALLPTGDAPVEVTFGLVNSRVSSGGNSFGRSSLVWPGDAAANLGPLLIAAGLEEIGATLPPYPLVAQASQADGTVETSIPPVLVMRADGFEDRGAGESRFADVELPGVLRIDQVASTASSVVSPNDVTSVARSVLSGISLLGGTITIEEVRSEVRTTSRGTTAESSGTTDVLGLRIAGIEVSVTDKGFEVEGVPEADDIGLPGLDVGELLNDLLEALGISLTLFEGSVTEGEGRVQRFEPGLVVSIESPIPETGPIPPGRFDLFLATASASAMATPPFTGDFGAASEEAAPGVGDPGLTVTAPTAPRPAATLGPGADVDPGAVSGIGAGTGAGEALMNGAAADYRFEGLPVAMVLALMGAALVAAWYIRGLIQSLLAGGAGTSAGGGEGDG